MNIPSKTKITVEHHNLELRYAPLRLHKRGLLDRLSASIEAHGQQVPVIVVPLTSHQWVLMDGYLRVKALRRLCKDTVDAEVWACEPSEALLHLLTEKQSRAFEIVEEALLLRELHLQHGLSQSVIATRMGKDQSWVSRRLSLLETLSESMLKAITHGKLSLWSATRILAPMARAIPLHAELLLQYLLKNALSTRELNGFYDCYQKAAKVVRTQMVNELDLFFKTQKWMASDKQARVLEAGPEGKWEIQLRLIQQTLPRLTALSAQVFIPQQEPQERDSLLSALKVTHSKFQLLIETIRRLTDAQDRPTSNHHQLA